MALVLFLTRLLLALVFLVADLAKLADLPGSRQAVHDFGVPTSLAGPLGTLAPSQPIELIGGLVVLAGLIGALWLLWQVLRQQGRLLLRLEAVEARLAEAGPATRPGGAAPVQQNGNGAMARSRSSAPAIGEPAPDFSLPDLAGNLVQLPDFRGSSTLVLFWRPSCGFCQRMLADLKAWEARRPEGAPALVVVSSESVADNRAMGLRSPTLLDHTAMSVGSQFGATGTPMAVLVDEDGKIASTLAAGAPAVLALMRSFQDTHAPVGV